MGNYFFIVVLCSSPIAPRCTTMTVIFGITGKQSPSQQAKNEKKKKKQGKSFVYNDVHQGRGTMFHKKIHGGHCIETSVTSVTN